MYDARVGWAGAARGAVVGRRRGWPASVGPVRVGGGGGGRPGSQGGTRRTGLVEVGGGGRRRRTGRSESKEGGGVWGRSEEEEEAGGGARAGRSRRRRGRGVGEGMDGRGVVCARTLVREACKAIRNIFKFVLHVAEV